MSSPTTLTVAHVADMTAALRGGGFPDDPAALISLLSELETLKSAACAVQAEAAVAYDAARRSAESERVVPARRQGRGVASEVALSRKESTHRGQTSLGLAKVLCQEMPHTLARLRDGTLNEFRAMMLVRETACLTAEHRALVDEEVCADPAPLEGVGTRRLLALAKRLAYELDPASVLRRARNAESDRNVTVRPAPDTMSYLTGLLPVAQGVAVHAALGRDADALRAQGDLRTRGQLMADVLVTRVTGADLVADAPPPVPVTVNLTMSDTTLLGGHRPAEVGADGVAPVVVPAEIGRLLVARALTVGVAAWIREACNHAKQAPGWRQRTEPDLRHAVETVTPSGHRYRSTAPPPVGWREPRWVKDRPGVYTLIA